MGEKFFDQEAVAIEVRPKVRIPATRGIGKLRGQVEAWTLHLVRQAQGTELVPQPTASMRTLRMTTAQGKQIYPMPNRRR